MKVLLIAAVLFLVGCDKEVGGVTFESGFGVSREQAWEEGYDAGIKTCRYQRRAFAKYKSSSSAFEHWSEGWVAGMIETGCKGQI